MTREEIWKEFNNTGYIISSFGRIKGKRTGAILKQSTSIRGYKKITLHINEKRINFNIHRLVWITFNGDAPGMQVDHIDHDKQNNFLSNLQLLNCRQNISKQKTTIERTSDYVGVSKYNSRYRSNICINRKQIHLGYFSNEVDASIAYQKALQTHLNAAA